MQVDFIAAFESKLIGKKRKEKQLTPLQSIPGVSLAPPETVTAPLGAAGAAPASGAAGRRHRRSSSGKRCRLYGIQQGEGFGLNVDPAALGTNVTTVEEEVFELPQSFLV